MDKSQTLLKARLGPFLQAGLDPFALLTDSQRGKRQTEFADYRRFLCSNLAAQGFAVLLQDLQEGDDGKPLPNPETIEGAFQPALWEYACDCDATRLRFVCRLRDDGVADAPWSSRTMPCARAANCALLKEFSKDPRCASGAISGVVR